MNHPRRKARIDENQKQIVAALRSVPGVSVVTGHDDLLVGWNGKTLWVEVKRFECYNKDCVLMERHKRESQKKFDVTFTGARIYAKCAEDVLEWFGIM